MFFIALYTTSLLFSVMLVNYKVKAVSNKLDTLKNSVLFCEQCLAMYMEIGDKEKIAFYTKRRQEMIREMCTISNAYCGRIK